MSALKLIKRNICRKNVEQLDRWRCYSTKQSDVSDAERPPTFIDSNPESTMVPEKTFNKSGLLRQHQNILHGKIPYSEPHSWIHLSEKYQRKLFGQYGTDSGVNPQICFKTNGDIAEQKEYEQLAQPKKLSEMINIKNLEETARKEAIIKREEEIAKKFEKLDQWKNELNAKVAKKEADVVAAKERKERLIEEVRRHFGFKVDTRDDRFKEMLEQKEREDKKKQKEAKRKAKEEKMMAKLVEKTSKLE